MTKAERELLCCIRQIRKDWVTLDLLRDCRVLAAEDTTTVPALVERGYLRLYDHARPDFAVGLTKAGIAAAEMEH